MAADIAPENVEKHPTAEAAEFVRPGWTGASRITQFGVAALNGRLIAVLAWLSALALAPAVSGSSRHMSAAASGKKCRMFTWASCRDWIGRGQHARWTPRREHRLFVIEIALSAENWLDSRLLSSPRQSRLYRSALPDISVRSICFSRACRNPGFGARIFTGCGVIKSDVG